ncbi:DUF3054 domain-containing protein [Kocuria sp. KD4]|uniref:DUF3054 domain-containing protein n=1 Tax=Kocuria sp. KD4 TaxID=2719588 RepID=UPI001427825E|nr:DUF3054 domain-containing protein [Kocuria sp. KD4]QIR69780.1 DUF3054 domain-containing protein [Kocuria sp. KD4]
MSSQPSPGSDSSTSVASPPQSPRPAPPAERTARAWPLFLAVDLVLVIVFAAIGRSAHGEDVLGMLTTAWPFLVGTLIGWFAARGAHRPAAVVPTGLVVWLSTEIVGMFLRTLTGQGTAWSFVLVSLVVLGVFLVGYRLVLAGVARVRRR